MTENLLLNTAPLNALDLDYQTFADALPEIIWIADADGKGVYYNQRWFEYLGLKPGDDPRSAAWDAIHPDDREITREQWRETYTSGNNEMRSEFRLRGADGEYRWFMAHGFAQRDAAGKTVRWLGSTVNVDAIKQTQESLLRSDDRYRALVDASSQVVWTNAADGKMTGLQPGWSRLTGQTQDEYEGYGWASAVHPDDAPPTIAAWEEAVRTRTPFLFEHRVRRHDGAWRLFSIRAVPVMEASDTIREWVGIHSDITEAKAAAANQVRTLAQLSAVMDSAIDGVIVADGAGQILIMNPAARTMQELPGNFAVPSSMDKIAAMLDLFTPDGEPIAPENAPLARGLRGEKFADYECRVVHKQSGAQWWASCSVSPVYENGNIALVILILRDVSERRVMETQRDALMHRVAEAAEKQRRFLREILSSMSEGRLRLCETTADLPAPVAALPAHESVTLDRMTIRTLRRQIAGACGAAGLPIERESDLITAVGEAAMNAVVHAGTGIGTVYVDEKRGVVQVFVSDSGTGINEESLHRATLEKGFTTAGTLGHGFWMMLKTADRVYLLTGATGTTVVMEQERKPPVPAWMQTFVDSSY